MIVLISSSLHTLSLSMSLADLKHSGLASICKECSGPAVDFTTGHHLSALSHSPDLDRPGSLPDHGIPHRRDDPVRKLFAVHCSVVNPMPAQHGDMSLFQRSRYKSERMPNL
jgi:hypothetical protein